MHQRYNMILPQKAKINVFTLMFQCFFLNGDTFSDFRAFLAYLATSSPSSTIAIRAKMVNFPIFFISRGICENAMNLPQRNAWNTSNNLENFLKIARSKNFRKSFTEFLASRRNYDNFNRSHVYRKFANPWAKKILEQHTKNVSKFRHATSI